MLPAILLTPIARYAIVGAGSAILGFGLAWWLQSDRVAGVKDQLAAMTTQRDMAAQDAQRWARAAEERRLIIDQRNAEVEAAKADLAQAEAILQTADMAAQAEAQDLNAEIAKWKARAHERPDQTCTLGPLDRDAVRVLVGP